MRGALAVFISGFIITNIASTAFSQQPAAEKSADLFITTTDGAVMVAAGRNVAYTIEIKNLGPNDAENVVVTDRVPDDTRYAGGSCKNQNGILTCNIGKIAAGKSARATFSVSVNSSATGTIVSTAMVNSSTPDPVQTNNSGTDSDTTIFAESDLGVTLTSDVTTAAVAQKVVYTALLTNAGPSDCAGATMELEIPAGMSFVSATANGKNENGKVVWAIDALKDGARSQGQATLSVDDTAAAGDLTAILFANGEGDPAPENNKATAAVTLQ